MILTLTLNPAIDYYLRFDHFVEGEINEPVQANVLAGGKGVNVAIVLNRLGVPVECRGFVGGFSGEFILQSVRRCGILCDFDRIGTDNRINIKMTNQARETEIPGISPLIGQSEWNHFLQRLKDRLLPGDTLVLSGSLPAGLPADAYAQVINRCSAGVRVILDARGSILKTTLDSLDSTEIFLLKPNWKEFEALCGQPLDSWDDAIRKGIEWIGKGVKYLLISKGADGACLIGESMVYKSGAYEGDSVSTVGAGDSMIAGFLWALSVGKSTEEAFKAAVAAGSSTAFSSDLCTKRDFMELFCSDALFCTFENLTSRYH